MREWYLRCRTWADLSQGEFDWYMFAIDEQAGHPSRFRGEPEDVLRLLEDEVRDLIDRNTEVERSADALFLTMRDPQFGDLTFWEGVLVNPAAWLPRQRAEQEPPLSGRLLLDNSGAVPNPFRAEFHVVAAEVGIDLDLTIAHADPDVGYALSVLFIEALGIDDDPGEAIRRVMSVCMWIFMIGREHALRGCESAAFDESSNVRPVIDRALRYDRASSTAVPVMGALEGRESFAGEFHEVCGDVLLDYQQTMQDLDQQVGHNVNRYVAELFRLAAGDTARVVQLLLSAALWMFELGRAHSERGFLA